MKKIVSFSTIGLALLLPAVLFAQAPVIPNFANTKTLLGNIGGVINAVLPVIFALAILYFFWGLAKFVLAAGDEEERKKGKQIMLWGIIALFVMTAVFGLVNLLVSGAGLTGNTVNLPNVNLKPGSSK